MNDAPVDCRGYRTTSPTLKRRVLGKALPALGLTAFLDLNWSEEVYQHDRVLPRGYQYHRRSGGDCLLSPAQYALTNILFYPVKNVMFRAGSSSGAIGTTRRVWHVPDYRVQFSARIQFQLQSGGDSNPSLLFLNRLPQGSCAPSSRHATVGLRLRIRRHRRHDSFPGPSALTERRPWASKTATKVPMRNITPAFT